MDIDGDYLHRLGVDPRDPTASTEPEARSLSIADSEVVGDTCFCVIMTIGRGKYRKVMATMLRHISAYHTCKATCLVGYTMWLTERTIRRVQSYTTTSIYDSSKQTTCISTADIVIRTVVSSKRIRLRFEKEYLLCIRHSCILA